MPSTVTAHTPEDLEALLEDTLLMGDHDCLTALFDLGALLVTADSIAVRGSETIACHAAAFWKGDHAYVADPLRICQARDLALIVTERSINVVRRGADGAWRYAIIVATQ